MNKEQKKTLAIAGGLSVLVLGVGAGLTYWGIKKTMDEFDDALGSLGDLFGDDDASSADASSADDGVRVIPDDQRPPPGARKMGEAGLRSCPPGYIRCRWKGDNWCCPLGPNLSAGVQGG